MFQVNICDLRTAFRLQIHTGVGKWLLHKWDAVEHVVSWHNGRPANLLPRHLLSVDFWAVWITVTWEVWIIWLAEYLET